MKCCNVCGVKKGRTLFSKCRGNPDGLQRKCKECHKEYSKHYRETHENETKQYAKEYYKDNKDWIAAKSQTKKRRLNAYRCNAKSRSLSFELTDSDFSEMWQNPCTYCGDAIKPIGLDRLDSTLGYTTANCTPCCSDCNYMKRQLTFDEFIAKIRKVLNFIDNVKS